MQLTLDQTQRLNLITLLDPLECKGVREVFAIYELQRMLELDAAEKEAIDYLEETIDGIPQMRWNALKTTPRQFEFSDADYSRLRRAIENWQGSLAPGMVRAWLKPLWLQMEANGHKEQ